MRGRSTALALLALHGCATASEPEDDYDEISRVLGSAFQGADGGGELGAFADSARLARGGRLDGFSWVGPGLIEGWRGEATHRYAVACVDATSRPLDACGLRASRAFVIATWDGPLETADHPGRIHRLAVWTFDDPFRDVALVSGGSRLWYEAPGYDLYDTREVLVEMDMAHRVITNGAMTTRISMENADARAMRGEIELTSATATITLDGTHATAVDLRPPLIR